MMFHHNFIYLFIFDGGGWRTSPGVNSRDWIMEVQYRFPSSLSFSSSKLYNGAVHNQLFIGPLIFFIFTQHSTAHHKYLFYNNGWRICQVLRSWGNNYTNFFLKVIRNCLFFFNIMEKKFLKKLYYHFYWL